MTAETATLELLTRTAPVRSFDAESRTFEMVWTTGAKVRRYDYHRSRWYDEELSLDPAHVRMGRLNSGRAPLLDSHATWGGVRSTLGVVREAKLTPEATAKAKFSKRADAAEIMEDVRDGITTNVSVGYRVHRFEMLEPRGSDGVWTYRATDWEPYEISLVPIPAEADSNVRGADPFNGARSAPCEFINPAALSVTTEQHMMRELAANVGVKVEKDMADAAVRSAVLACLGLEADSTDEQIVAAAFKRSAAPPAPVAPSAPVDETAAVRAEAERGERARVASLITFCAKHRASPEFQAKAIEQGWSQERAGFELLNERNAKGEAAPTSNVQGDAGEATRAFSWDQVLKSKFGVQ